jgi:5-methylcytosine-specific restriction endonuclease McrA
MRRHIFYRDWGICAACGKKHGLLNGDWEADHILPLMISLGDPSFWDPDNLQLLCKKPCHQKKSTEDRRKYRKRDRLRMKRKYDDIEAME